MTVATLNSMTVATLNSMRSDDQFDLFWYVVILRQIHPVENFHQHPRHTSSRCHSVFVPPRKYSGGTNSLADSFRQNECVVLYSVLLYCIIVLLCVVLFYSVLY